MAFVNGNLCYQIEHHLYPDLPSNRYAEIAVRVRALCEKYDLPLHHGIPWSLVPAVVLDDPQTCLPDKLLKATCEDAREISSEVKFRIRDGLRDSFVDPDTGKRRGLRTALRELRGGATRRVPEVDLW
jgi:NADPH-dependent stearoyl-CoA 9-desaturase